MDRVTDCKKAQTGRYRRVVALEAYCNDTQHNHTAVLLQLDDIKNRNRRNNFKLTGIPESYAGSDLTNMVTGILNMFHGKQPDTNLEIDRVHQVGLLALPNDLPRNVL